MTRDDIIRMAQECQLIGMRPHLDGIYESSLERFAALVAAAEREACAGVAEQNGADEPYGHAKFRCHNIAEAIRARGQA